jgi:hypothetical protein
MFKRFANVHVEIHDPVFLKTIPVLLIEKYLEHHQWKLYHEIQMNGVSKGWIYEKEEMLVTVPKSEEFADYALRLSELLQRVNVIEEGNQLSIVEEIFSFGDNERKEE